MPVNDDGPPRATMTLTNDSVASGSTRRRSSSVLPPPMFPGEGGDAPAPSAQRSDTNDSQYKSHVNNLRRASSIARSMQMFMKEKDGHERRGSILWEQEYIHEALVGRTVEGTGEANDDFDSDEEFEIGVDPPYRHIERAYKSTEKHRRVEEWQQDNMASVESSYFENSMEEQALVGPLMHYTNLFQEFTSALADTPPMICPKNECGVRKFVCCTVTPTKPIETAKTEVEIAEFVKTYLAYEPLPFPGRIPPILPSPSTVMEWQIADSYDYANVLCSFLIGAGYDAYVVSGTAPRKVAQLNTQDQDNPYSIDHSEDAEAKMEILDNGPEVVEVDGDDDETLKGYLSAGLTKHLSNKTRFDPSHQDGGVVRLSPSASRLSAASTANASNHEGRESPASPVRSPAMDKKMKMNVEVASPRTAMSPRIMNLKRGAESPRVSHPAHRRTSTNQNVGSGKGGSTSNESMRDSVHAWVMVVATDKSHIPLTAFIEPTTAEVHMLNKSPYFKIYTLWNNRNYYLCLQDQNANDTSELSYDLNDPQQWMPLFPTTNSRFIVQSCSTQHLHRRLTETKKSIPVNTLIHPPLGMPKKPSRGYPELSTVVSEGQSEGRSSFENRKSSGGPRSSFFESDMETETHNGGITVVFRDCLQNPQDHTDFTWSKPIRVPYNCRASQYRSAKVCDFAKSRVEFFPHFDRNDGMVCRITDHVDRPHRTTDPLERDKVQGVVEKYFRRKDMLQHRLVDLGQTTRMTEKFAFGRKDRLKLHTFVRGTSRDLWFYPGAHIHTGLKRRFTMFNEYVCEEYEDWRTDRLSRRYIKIRAFSLADLAVSISLREKYGPLPPSKNPTARARLQDALRRLRWASSFVRRGTTVEVYNDNQGDNSSILYVTEYFSREEDESAHTDMDISFVTMDLFEGTITVGLYPIPGSIVSRKVKFGPSGSILEVVEDHGKDVLVSKLSRRTVSEGVVRDDGMASEPQKSSVDDEGVGTKSKGAFGHSELHLQVLFKKMQERKLMVLDELKGIADVCQAVNKTRSVEEAERVKVIRPRNEEDIEHLTEGDLKKKKNKILDMWNQSQYRKFGLQMEYGYRWLQKVEERRRRGRLRKATEMTLPRTRRNTTVASRAPRDNARQKSLNRPVPSGQISREPSPGKALPSNRTGSSAPSQRKAVASNEDRNTIHLRQVSMASSIGAAPKKGAASSSSKMGVKRLSFSTDASVVNGIVKRKPSVSVADSGKAVRLPAIQG